MQLAFSPPVCAHWQSRAEIQWGILYAYLAPRLSRFRARVLPQSLNGASPTRTPWHSRHAASQLTKHVDARSSAQPTAVTACCSPFLPRCNPKARIFLGTTTSQVCVLPCCLSGMYSIRFDSSNHSILKFRFDSTSLGPGHHGPVPQGGRSFSLDEYNGFGAGRLSYEYCHVACRVSLK